MVKRASAAVDTAGVCSLQPRARKATRSEEAASGAAAIDQAARDNAVMAAAPAPAMARPTVVPAPTCAPVRSEDDAVSNSEIISESEEEQPAHPTVAPVPTCALDIFGFGAGGSVDFSEAGEEVYVQADLVRTMYRMSRFDFVDISPRMFRWSGNLVRPRWIDDGPVDSPLMLGAFFSFIQKCSRKAMWTCLPLDIIFHREFTSASTTCSIATFNGLLQPKDCKRPSCYQCRKGLGVYDFRWTSDDWGWVYIQKFEEITSSYIRIVVSSSLDR